MKAYTDLEQSKKLAEILPLESADMCWTNHCYGVMRSSMTISAKTVDEYKSLLDMFNDSTSTDIFYPAWSLAALINVLPTTIGNFFEKNMLRLRIDKGENDFNIWYENFDYGDVVEGLDVIEDNLVDACVEMIKKLHEQKLYN
jgi:hypothetical protein